MVLEDHLRLVIRDLFIEIFHFFVSRNLHLLNSVMLVIIVFLLDCLEIAFECFDLALEFFDLVVFRLALGLDLQKSFFFLSEDYDLTVFFALDALHFLVLVF